MLANSIVNVTGKFDGRKEIDLFNEHLNKSIKETFRHRANSSFDFLHSMDYASLNAVQFSRIRALIDKFFGVYHSGKHHTKDAEKDIYYYADILRKSRSFFQKDPSQRVDVIEKDDLFNNGLCGLQERIKRFNDSLPGGMTGGEDAEELDELAEGGALGDFFDIPQDDNQDDMVTGLESLRETIVPSFDPDYEF